MGVTCTRIVVIGIFRAAFGGQWASCFHMISILLGYGIEVIGNVDFTFAIGIGIKCLIARLYDPIGRGLLTRANTETQLGFHIINNLKCLIFL